MQTVNYAAGWRRRRLRCILDFETFLCLIPINMITPERNKGDHKHVGSQEESYRFIDVETLVADFLAEIEKVRRK